MVVCWHCFGYAWRVAWRWLELSRARPQPGVLGLHFDCCAEQLRYSSGSVPQSEDFVLPQDHVEPGILGWHFDCCAERLRYSSVSVQSEAFVLPRDQVPPAEHCLILSPGHWMGSTHLFATSDGYRLSCGAGYSGAPRPTSCGVERCWTRNQWSIVVRWIRLLWRTVGRGDR